MQTIQWNNHTLSKLSLGTVQFGLEYGIANKNRQMPKSESFKILEYVVQQDINTFDTAQAYGNSEQILGNFFIQHPNGYNIISKIGSDAFNKDSNTLEDVVQKSLQNLQSDKLFAMLLHDSDVLYEWDHYHTNIIENLKEKNMIDQFGISIYTDNEFNLALQNPDIHIIQIPFNIFDQRALTLEWIKKAKETNKLLFIRSIYLQGLLLMCIDDIPIHLSHAKPYIQKLENLSLALNSSINQLCISFVNQMAPDAVLIFGCDSLEQAKLNIENFNIPMKISEKNIALIKDQFQDIDESIYNPTKWERG